MTTQSIPVHIPDAGLSALAAYVSPVRWNGWHMPYFTHEQGMALIPQCAALVAVYGPDEADALAWDDTRGVFTLTRAGEVEDVDTLTVDGVTLHGIGAACWTWELKRH